jgi:hypothetical protein
MEVKIIKEQGIENKIYFEVTPKSIEYQNTLLFGIEKEGNINNEDDMIILRAEVMILASDEFDKQL